jgi:phosphohistidine phosphatase
MPLKLYLMRHAQSADKQPGQADKERELTTVGMRQSLQIGGYLHSQKFFFDLFLSSTANRAKATSEFVLEALKMSGENIQFDEEIYNASTRTLFSQIANIDNKFTSVILVGHNPSITYLAEYLTKNEIGDMTPAGLAMIQFGNSKWSEIQEGSGELVRYICPELL